MSCVQILDTTQKLASLTCAKAFAYIDISGGQPIISGQSYNIASVVREDNDNPPGRFVITFTNPFPDTNYVVLTSTYGQVIPFSTQSSCVIANFNRVSNSQVHIYTAVSNTKGLIDSSFSIVVYHA